MNFNKKAKLVAVIGSLCAGGLNASFASAESSAIEEVVVTGAKRGEQNLQDVAISMAVLGGDSLEASSLSGVAEALGQVAGLNLFEADMGGGYKLSMRGVTAGGPLLVGGSTVGYYIDDAPWALVRSAVVPDANPYDLERIEVLRGPQGTLYGSSALNGVIRVMTKDANLDEFEFKARGSASHTDAAEDNYRGDMAINMPLIPGKLAARLVVSESDQAGWVDNVIEDNTNDAQQSNWRLKIAAQPADNLELRFTANQSKSDFGAPSISEDDGTSVAEIDEPLSQDYDMYGLQIDYEFESFSLHSSTTSIDYVSDGILDFGGGTALRSLFETKVFSQELNAVSSLDGPWQWTAGLFYRDAEDDLTQEVVVWDYFGSSRYSSESFAVFGEITRRFMDDQFELTAGLRYFEDDVRVQDMGLGEDLSDNETSFSNVSPRLVLSWFADDDLTVYGSISEGFRSGIYQSPGVSNAAPGIPPASEDTLMNYEVGAKGSTFDGRLRFDAAVYYIDWSDVQQSLGVSLPDTDAYFGAIVNGESASGMGIDADLVFAATDNLQLGLNASWNDLTSDADVYSSGSIFVPNGGRLSESPETTLGLNFDYMVNLPSSNLEGQFSGSANYHSKVVNRSDAGGAISVGEADDMLITRLSFAVKSEKLTTTVYVNNVGNEDGATAVVPGTANSGRIRPRTVGLQFQYQY